MLKFALSGPQDPRVTQVSVSEPSRRLKSTSPHNIIHRFYLLRHRVHRTSRFHKTSTGELHVLSKYQMSERAC
ncbi:hypothetical protein BLNAU_23526 [Blattamonas nauphoetae]|uniref:Uncharacterized protein n=1 Tax=Blattamonas nauphoetae TaxID=2049346 RepID=A0ABQ9WQE6_9EUKA|nr:hypothetical protein BLNAU_23526 [Blattamonas nauphoetae]